MAKLIKINDTKAYRIGIIQMGKNVKGEPKKPRLLSIRQMYKTKKEPDVWKPGYAGITIPLGDIGKRILRAIVAVFKDEDPKVEVIEVKDKGEGKKKSKKKRSK